MRVPVSPHRFRWLDRLSKLVGLVLLAVALEGSLGDWSLLVGVAALVIGGGTIFLDSAGRSAAADRRLSGAEFPPEEEPDEDDATDAED